jgi:hypothetical protein
MNDRHLLHLDAVNKYGEQYRLECVGHEEAECDGHGWWDEVGIDLVHHLPPDPTFPVAVRFADCFDLSRFDTWSDAGGPVLVPDPTGRCDSERAELLAAALLIRGVTAYDCDALDEWLREGGKCTCAAHAEQGAASS